MSALVESEFVRRFCQGREQVVCKVPVIMLQSVNKCYSQLANKSLKAVCVVGNALNDVPVKYGLLVNGLQ